ncbi:probable LRR receptor-like serine/threonine-protein kinase RFK1 [Vitis riparia]|uniref:probable LRR receptor-like serine/threonine-protein kinase RFK1 n=1 Tax=Vitis riparia TaxID=96939 RepID=UPI00155B144C|nr:probable LRR receptor-like serine/threonine-protein kinase RFK1 [Vitis riparia]
MIVLKHVLLLSALVLVCSGIWTCVVESSGVPQEEVDALKQIAKTMGIIAWEFKLFNASDCVVGTVEIAPPAQPDQEAVSTVTCDCSFSDATCHIVSIILKRLNLPGTLPPELANLTYLQNIDFAYNYLNGSIPTQWASMPLINISLLANRLSGEIPKEIGNFANLSYLNLEANQFSGPVPSEIGKLVNLHTLILSSNQLSETLPKELGGLDLRDFRINDNNFNGTIPDFIQNWIQLTRLEMHASGLQGPIPSNISVLKNLNQLRISDINGTNQPFPVLDNIKSLRRLVLRNCNISGEIPSIIWRMTNLRVLDLSFNKLTGELPTAISSDSLKFIFLTGNLLSGNISGSFLKDGVTIDLSYNNFTWQSPEQPACDNYNGAKLNLFQAFSKDNSLKGVLPCRTDLECKNYGHSLYVNCGGEKVKVNENKRSITYEGDTARDNSDANYYLSADNNNWGFSSSGDFMDDNNELNKDYIITSKSQISETLYNTARISPLSLTYFRYCLQNGSYSVRLHFAEIEFTNDSTYGSLGKRMFDIYAQDELVKKDFNIEDHAKGALKPYALPFNATVTNNVLEIRFYFAGRGTTRIPQRGVYGPLISAISVDPNFTPPSEGGKTKTAPIIIGVVAACLICLALGIFWWRGNLRTKNGREKDFGGLDVHIGSFTLKQIKAATNNFDSLNQIGEGGFGPVYKGLLPDGTAIAVKQLSSKSTQGNREFLNEIGMISCLQHPNLVKLHGCCIEGNQLLLVYEYMENNSLARALLGPENCQLKLDWPTRQKICVGIARGLAFLHEESRLKIVHRDIKGTNVLLDGDLNPKISDFGLAKLHEEEKTHISTRVAGTIGYMAPEYALWGYLTYKADVYSFGVVALEIVSGKHNMSYRPKNDCACLLDWACFLQQSGDIMELVDQKLGSEFNKKEAERMIKVALLCTNASPSLRPNMSEAVSMLEGITTISDAIPEAGSYSEDLRFKAIREYHNHTRSQVLENK